MVKIQDPELSSTKRKKVLVPKPKEVVHKETDVSLSNKESIIFRYPPKSKLQQRQSSLVPYKILKGLTLLVTKLDAMKILSPLIKGSNIQIKSLK